ncbi:unnamed protein product [Larinioides sclopetarius]|uniref:Apple domain-containing protein n=1 Tax=Larinioides sclopetarius TaxID=280406 RepID=A0AAV2BQ46_9ARAC
MLSLSTNQRHFFSFFFLFSAFQVSAFQVSMTQFYFWFEHKVHDNWILDTFENSHLVTCLQKCKDAINCSALALGPLRETEEDFVRTCYTLSEITEADCDENNSCEKKGFQVFHLSKPMQPTAKTENPSTTTEASTYDSSTTSVASSTTVGISTAVDISTTTTKVPFSITQVSSTTNEPSTPTTESLTTTNEPSTPTTESLTITNEPSTPTTESLTTTHEPHTTTTESTTSTTYAVTENSGSTSATTNAPIPPKTSTVTSESSSTSTESPSTITESLSPMSESTTTTNEVTSVGTEIGTSTTGSSTTTTDASDCSNSDSPDCQIDNRRNSKCSGTEASIICREPRDQLQVFGLVSIFSFRTAPLFSDARMQVRCKNEFSQSLFKMKTRKDTYNPFDGTMGCKPDHTITGIDVCFQGELKYISVECNPLQPGFTIEDKTDMAGNSKQDPAQANCPEEKSMISLRLNKDSNGEINKQPNGVFHIRFLLH